MKLEQSQGSKCSYLRMKSGNSVLSPRVFSWGSLIFWSLKLPSRYVVSFYNVAYLINLIIFVVHFDSYELGCCQFLTLMSSMVFDWIWSFLKLLQIFCFLWKNFDVFELGSDSLLSLTYEFQFHGMLEIYIWWWI